MEHYENPKSIINRMLEKKFKIGYSEIGGIFIGRNIQSNFHDHYAITILISLGDPFKITTVDLKQDLYKVAIIQKNINYDLQSSENDFLAFIHIVPYSEIGINLSDRKKAIKKLDINHFENSLKELKTWFGSSENDTGKVENLLNMFSQIPQTLDNEKVLIDSRIRKSFDLIIQNENEKLAINEIAKSIHLSSSHFARLFKRETEMTFREFVLHRKLIKSIYAMYKENSLTEAAFIGGFSDQPHFTRTFKNSFGINPSSSRK